MIRFTFLLNLLIISINYKSSCSLIKFSIGPTLNRHEVEEFNSPTNRID